MKVDKYIVGRIVAALRQLKQCRTEEERVGYHIVLAALAPELESVRSQAGMGRAVSERLGIARGARYIGGTKRLYAFDQAIACRSRYDEECFQSGPLEAGDEATSRGRPCTIVEIDYQADTCKLCFSTGGVSVIRDYSCIYKGTNPPSTRAPFPKNSARLCRTPPSLYPKSRETRCDELAEKARPKVEELFASEGAQSPMQRDTLRRRVGVRLV